MVMIHMIVTLLMMIILMLALINMREQQAIINLEQQFNDKWLVI